MIIDRREASALPALTRLETRVQRVTLWLWPVLAVVAAILVSGVVLLAAGINPIAAYRALLDGALGSHYGVSNTLTQATPLLLAGLGALVAFRCSLWNIGLEGQIYMGALFATWAGIRLTVLPWPLHAIVTILFGFLGGAVWAGIPALLRIGRDVNETISTLLLNYVAILFVEWAIRRPLDDPTSTFPQSAVLAPSAWLPQIWSGTQLHLGVVLALLFALAVSVLLWRTTLGFRIRSVGINATAARYAGIPVGATVIAAMGISGGLAGVAGASEIMGLHHQLLDGFSPGYGFYAIAVALLGQLRPAGIVAAAFFLGMMLSGAGSMQRLVGVPITLVNIVLALILLSVASGWALSRVSERRARQPAATGT